MEVWYKQLKNHSSPDCKIFLIGNKADLESERQVTYEEGEDCRNKFNFCSFFETSAKTGINVKELFIEATKIVFIEQIALKPKEENKKQDDAQQLKKLNKNLAGIVDEEKDNGLCCQ